MKKIIFFLSLLILSSIVYGQSVDIEGILNQTIIYDFFEQVPIDQRTPTPSLNTKHVAYLYLPLPTTLVMPYASEIHFAYSMPPDKWIECETLQDIEIDITEAIPGKEPDFGQSLAQITVPKGSKTPFIGQAISFAIKKPAGTMLAASSVALDINNPPAHCITHLKDGRTKETDYWPRFRVLYATNSSGINLNNTGI